MNGPFVACSLLPLHMSLGVTKGFLAPFGGFVTDTVVHERERRKLEEAFFGICQLTFPDFVKDGPRSPVDREILNLI